MDCPGIFRSSASSSIESSTSNGVSRCSKCEYYTWPCYGCGVTLCSCCTTHCDKYNYGFCSAKEKTIEQQQQDLQNRDTFRRQQKEIEALKSGHKVLEEELIQEESSLKAYFQKKRGERTARSLALVDELAAQKRAIHRQSFLDETKAMYNKFISNLALEVTLKESVAQEATTSASEENHYVHLETPSYQPEASPFSDACPAPTIHSDSGLSSSDFQEDSDCLSEDSNLDDTRSIFSSVSLEDVSYLDPIPDPIPLRKSASLDSFFQPLSFIIG